MFLSRFFKLHYWPGITCIWFIASFVLTYFVSVLNGHVYPYFPFISDTGSVPPESCIFAQLMCIGAALMAVIAYIRYHQVHYIMTTENVKMNKLWNILGILSGFISCLGITVVGSFQETVLLPVHLLGAIMVFGNGSIYLLIQTRITYGLRHIYNKNSSYEIGSKTLCLRIIITICFACLYGLTCICAILALLKFSGTTIIWWTEEEPGYNEHLAAAISEWVMVAVFFVYLYTFTYDFKSFEFVETTMRTKCIVKSKPNIEQSV